MRKATWSPGGDASLESSGIFRRQQLPGGGTGGMPLKGIHAPGLLLSLCFPSAGTVSSSTGSCCHNILLRHKSRINRVQVHELKPLNPWTKIWPFPIRYPTSGALLPHWGKKLDDLAPALVTVEAADLRNCATQSHGMRIILSVLEGKLPCGDHSVSASHQGCATC